MISLFAYLIHRVATRLLGHADKLAPLKTKLVSLINQNTGITLGKLIQLTQCTVAEARIARVNADLGV
jgi:hypothetical protein